MGEFARVDSVDALRRFRVTLCKFAETAKVALSEAETEVSRTVSALRHERQPYWRGQLQQRRELTQRAKLALMEKQNEQTPLGNRPSCVDEKQALALARRRLEEAEQKSASVQRWMRRLEQEAFTFKGAVQRLAQAVDADIPNALAKLDRMIASLETYAPTAPATMPDTAGPAPAQSAGGPTAPPRFAPEPLYAALRRRAPSQTIRDRTPVNHTCVPWLSKPGPTDAMPEPPAGAPTTRLPLISDTKVLFADVQGDPTHMYLTRSPTATAGDSGWFLGFTDDLQPGHYGAIRLGDLLDQRPGWRVILELPAGTVALWEAGMLAAVVDPQGRPLWSPTGGNTGRSSP